MWPTIESTVMDQEPAAATHVVLRVGRQEQTILHAIERYRRADRILASWQRPVLDSALLVRIVLGVAIAGIANRQQLRFVGDKMKHLACLLDIAPRVRTRGSTCRPWGGRPG